MARFEAWYETLLYVGWKSCNIPVSPIRGINRNFKTAWYILCTQRRLLFTVLWGTIRAPASRFWNKSWLLWYKMLYDTLLRTFPLFIFNSNIVTVLRTWNIGLFSLQSPGSHHIEQQTLHCEHLAKSLWFPGFSITISCIPMFTKYRYESWTIKN
jgi:hypothetical protein